MAIRGLFWVLHEEPSALKTIFSIESQAKSTAERFHGLVEHVKKDIDKNLIDFDMSSALSEIAIETEESKIARESEAQFTPDKKSTPYKILEEAQLATGAASEAIQALLLASNKENGFNKERLLKNLNSRTEHSKVLTYVTRSKQFTDITMVITGLPSLDSVTGENVPNTDAIHLHYYLAIQSHYALQIEAQHNLKALPKAYQRSSFLEINHVSEAEDQAKIRHFISDVNNGLKVNVDTFGKAMTEFLESERA